MLLDCLAAARRHTALQDTRLLMAPRHPERFDEVAILLAKSGFRYVRRSQTRVVSAEAQNAEVILLDSIGELAAVYEFAAVVFVGGSLVPRGGHNIIEAAAYAKPVVVGPHTENFRQVIADFAAADAVTQIAGGEKAAVAEAFNREMLRLLADEAAAQAMGRRALEILRKHRGATACVFALIGEVMKQHERSAAVTTFTTTTTTTTTTTKEC